MMHGIRMCACPWRRVFLLALLTALPGLAASGREVAGIAAEQGLSSEAGQSAYAAGRFIDALRIWRPLAESGDPRAAYGLGLLYDLGQGVAQDAAAALLWYRRAAEGGFVLAEFNVAVMYDSGLGTPRDPAEAALWYASAAAHGYARAEYNLAQLYQYGDGVPQNASMADSWYTSAANHGLSAAASKLASLRAAHARSASSGAAGPALTPATPSGPPVDPIVGPGESALAELSFAAPAQSYEVDYFVTVVALDAAGFHSAFAGFTNRSAILVPLPRRPGRYAWRIYTIARAVPDYAPSAWKYFSVR